MCVRVCMCLWVWLRACGLTATERPVRRQRRSQRMWVLCGERKGGTPCDEEKKGWGSVHARVRVCLCAHVRAIYICIKERRSRAALLLPVHVCRCPAAVLTQAPLLA